MLFYASNLIHFVYLIKISRKLSKLHGRKTALLCLKNEKGCGKTVAKVRKKVPTQTTKR